MSVRNLKIILVMSILGVLSVFLIYAFEIEPYNIEITHTYVEIDNSVNDSQNSCKLMVISDLHADKRLIDNAIKKMNSIIEKEKIDAVIIGGDLIHYKEEEIISLEELKYINGKIYAVLGNHDYGFLWKNKELADKVEKYLENLNIDVLRNENRMICDGKIKLIGVDCIWAKQDNLEKAFYERNVEKNKPEILISHHPDIIYKLDNKTPDFIISGHTHGGQVRIPLIDKIYIPLFMPSKVGKFCLKGLCEINGQKIYITRGIGGRPRFLCPPEISIIELKFIR